MPLAVFYMRMSGEEMLTTLTFQSAAGPGQAEADALRDFWRDGLAYLQSDRMTLEGIGIDGDIYAYNEPGNITRESVPSNVAVVMRKLTGTSVRGRFFMPGLTDENVDNAGRLDGAYQAAFAQQMPIALAALQAAGVTPMVQSATQGQLPITAITVNPIVGTQRRRLARR